MRRNLVEAVRLQPGALAGAWLSRMVTVVDASTFLIEFEKKQSIGQRPDLGADNLPVLAGQRQIVDLLCEQAGARG